MTKLTEEEKRLERNRKARERRARKKREFAEWYEKNKNNITFKVESSNSIKIDNEKITEYKM